VSFQSKSDKGEKAALIFLLSLPQSVTLAVTGGQTINGKDRKPP
jgi:hypothetical protein